MPTYTEIKSTSDANLIQNHHCRCTQKYLTCSPQAVNTLKLTTRVRVTILDMDSTFLRQTSHGIFYSHSHPYDGEGNQNTKQSTPCPPLSSLSVLVFCFVLFSQH